MYSQNIHTKLLDKLSHKYAGQTLATTYSTQTSTLTEQAHSYSSNNINNLNTDTCQGSEQRLHTKGSKAQTWAFSNNKNNKVIMQPT